MAIVLGRKGGGAGGGSQPVVDPAYAAAIALGPNWLDEPAHGIVESAGGEAGVSDPMLTLSLAAATVEIGQGAALVANAAGDKNWFCYFDAATNLFADFAPPDATDPRKDLIVVQVTDTATGAAELQVVEGTPDPDPEAPETPANSEPLYEITIPAAETDPSNWTSNTVAQDVRLAYNPVTLAEITVIQAAITALQGDISTEHASVDHEVANTTLQTHGELIVGCAAGFQWHFRFFVFLLNDGAAEGVKFAITGTAVPGTLGITAQVTIYDDTLGEIAGTGRVSALDTAFGSALSAGANHAVIEGVIDLNNGGTEGTVGLAFAQNAAGAGAGVHVQVNSSGQVTRQAQSSV